VLEAVAAEEEQTTRVHGSSEGTAFLHSAQPQVEAVNPSADKLLELLEA
jgi:hypothetical protein